MKLLVWLFIVTIILACSIHQIEKHIEHFDDNLQTKLNIITKDAFPCHENSTSSKRSGCFYQDLGGCILFDTNLTSGICPQSVNDFSLLQSTTSADPAAHNSDIFEFVYDAMKDFQPLNQCPDRLSSSCPLDFFKKISVMTDGEIDQYMARMKSEPCSEGAICLRPENVAAYISQQQSAINPKDLTLCQNNKKNHSDLKNKFSKGVNDRIFSKCIVDE